MQDLVMPNSNHGVVLLQHKALSGSLSGPGGVAILVARYPAVYSQTGPGKSKFPALICLS